MHPEQIKASIRMKGTTPSALADSMQRSRMLVSNVIHGRAISRPVADRIALLLGKPVHTLWPGKYKTIEVPGYSGVDRRVGMRRSKERGGPDRRMAPPAAAAKRAPAKRRAAA